MADAVNTSVVRITPACLGCGSDITDRRLSAKYCGDKCRNEAREKRRAPHPRTRTRPWENRPCRRCGVEFYIRKDNDRVFCGDVCKAAARADVFGQAKVRYKIVHRRSCLDCGVRFSPPAGAKYCSPRCGTRAINKANTAHKRAARPCKGCSSVFAPPYGRSQALYCSNRCATRAVKRVARSKERARLRNASIESVDPRRVFDRDGWRCHLCSRRTPERLRGSYDPRAPELDHIVPLSKGGEHSYRNTACACRHCNGLKSDGVAGQLRLFG